MRSSSQRGRRDDTIVISQTILPSDMQQPGLAGSRIADRGARVVSDADSVPGTGMWNTLSLSEAC
jgi:hypothetical protein